MSNRQYPSLVVWRDAAESNFCAVTINNKIDQYVPPAQPNPPVNYSHPPSSGDYSQPPPQNYGYPTPNDYPPQQHTPPPHAPAYGAGDKSNISAAPLFQDMGFLQDAVYSQVSSRLLDNGRQYVDKNFGRFMTLLPLKYYFNVNNRYVFNKLVMLLFPFLHKNWARAKSVHSDLHEPVPPREDPRSHPLQDINAPDLYIPTMAFVTYILLVGFLHGTALRFTPDVLGYTATTGLVILGLEICFIKFSFYLLNTRSIPFLDLLSYCGYIFVGLIVNIMSGLLIKTQWGESVSYFVPLYPGLCMAYFMLRSLGPAVPDVHGTPTIKTYILVIAALQVCVMFFLGMRSW